MDGYGTRLWTAAVDNVWNLLSRPRRELVVEGLGKRDSFL